MRNPLFREYIRGYKFLSKTILTCLSGAQVDLIHEIKKMPQKLTLMVVVFNLNLSSAKKHPDIQNAVLNLS